MTLQDSNNLKANCLAWPSGKGFGVCMLDKAWYHKAVTGLKGPVKG